jgi:hypothetical protein
MSQETSRENLGKDKPVIGFDLSLIFVMDMKICVLLYKL